jgi:heme exporter protein B
VRVALAILWKDLLSEWRSRDRVAAMLLFSLLVVAVFHFALPEGTGKREVLANAPGLLWVAYIFAALLGLNRAFALELENDALSGLALAPVGGGWLFLGKAVANFALISLVELATAFAFALVFDLDLLSIAPQLAVVVALGTAGICGIGTLVSAMAVRTRFSEVLLPVLLIPTLIPVLVGAVRGTAAVLAGEGVPFEAIQLLIVIDCTYWIVSFLAFDYVLDE